ncbi:hypothetical protein Tco_0953042 [Tanacetum coccineum]|uniref:Uncharacterized protein n=1 Tax=Tanacetum coccineum TaxID=301880 RepID=A0ABQ5E115_9ASTR
MAVQIMRILGRLQIKCWTKLQHSGVKCETFSRFSSTKAKKYNVDIGKDAFHHDPRRSEGCSMDGAVTEVINEIIEVASDMVAHLHTDFALATIPLLQRHCQLSSSSDEEILESSSQYPLHVIISSSRVVTLDATKVITTLSLIQSNLHQHHALNPAFLSSFMRYHHSSLIRSNGTPGYHPVPSSAPDPIPCRAMIFLNGFLFYGYLSSQPLSSLLREILSPARVVFCFPFSNFFSLGAHGQLQFKGIASVLAFVLRLNPFCLRETIVP